MIITQHPHIYGTPTPNFYFLRVKKIVSPPPIFRHQLFPDYCLWCSRKQPGQHSLLLLICCPRTSRTCKTPTPKAWLPSIMKHWSSLLRKDHGAPRCPGSLVGNNGDKNSIHCHPRSIHIIGTSKYDINKHIICIVACPGPTGSHWTPPSGDYLLCIGIAQVAASVTKMHQLCWLLAVLMAIRHW